ncbi:hypothetical protein G9A89_019868 [Geosiphon pyriformis]|nr:hypothetical protein G9A89_019868 [Geosiphon pyriformis]
MLIDYNTMWQPLLDQFNQGAVTTILVAWLPKKLEAFLSGNMAVDMFLISALAAAITALLGTIYSLGGGLFTGSFPWARNLVTVQVEYYVTGIYGDQSVSTLYEAISWLIGKQTKDLSKGMFIVQPQTADWDEQDDDDCKPPGFNVLPERGQDITITYKKQKFQVNFNMPVNDSGNDGNSNNNNNRQADTSKPMPSIYLSTFEDKNPKVDTVADFIENVTRAYLEDKKKKRSRCRYERTDGYWYRIQTLSASRGLDTVALDEAQEKLLEKELNTFIQDKEFYARIGMPYRRGILLYGKPGTGKTSLINAISAELNRDLYFVNLKNIKFDNELSAAFSGVPANQIIVLEDVDTMTRVVHRRSRKTKTIISDSSGNSGSVVSKDDDKPKGIGPDSSDFTLSTFLSCLDGHILSEGTIIIMTTNHVEHLDPAVIRPGRMDLRLDLGYCTRYQINKMYRTILEDSNAQFPPELLEIIPERVLPPCEVMMNMVLYRNDPNLITKKIFDLVETYRHKEYIPLEDQIIEEEEIEKTEKDKGIVKDTKELKNKQSEDLKDNKDEEESKEKEDKKEGKDEKNEENKKEDVERKESDSAEIKVVLTSSESTPIITTTVESTTKSSNIQNTIKENPEKTSTHKKSRKSLKDGKPKVKIITTTTITKTTITNDDRPEITKTVDENETAVSDSDNSTVVDSLTLSESEENK